MQMPFKHALRLHHVPDDYWIVYAVPLGGGVGCVVEVGRCKFRVVGSLNFQLISVSEV